MASRNNISWTSDPLFLWAGVAILTAMPLSVLALPAISNLVPTRVAALLCLGLMGGLHGASYGAYKDSPHESFIPRRFVRELTIAFCIAWAVAHWERASGENWFVLFVTIFALTRIVTEFWKLFVRTEPQENYRIPTQFHWLKSVVGPPWIRLLVGAGFLAAPYGLYCLFTLLPAEWPNLMRGVLIGLGFGAAEAVAGAYKDGSVEGFSIKKFFKSPLSCAIGGAIASQHTTATAFLMLAAYGSSRMFLELFFKILRPS